MIHGLRLPDRTKHANVGPNGTTPTLGFPGFVQCFLGAKTYEKLWAFFGVQRRSLET